MTSSRLEAQMLERWFWQKNVNRIAEVLLGLHTIINNRIVELSEEQKMTEAEAEYKVREAAYSLAADNGWNKAVDLLRKIAEEMSHGNNSRDYS